MVDAVVLQQGVIVAGHPRSGTSLACQLVQSADVEFPSDFEGDEYNRAGYFELEEAKRLSKDLLAEAMTPDNTKTMNSIVRQLNQVEGWGGLKLVRIPTIFFYRHLAKQLKTVLIFRHPAEVKASLFRRGISGFPISWIENNNALIAARDNIEQSILISYQSLLNRKEFVREKFEHIGLEPDLDIIDPAQKTQDKSNCYVTIEEKKMYKHLQSLEQNP